MEDKKRKLSKTNLTIIIVIVSLCLLSFCLFSFIPKILREVTLLAKESEPFSTPKENRPTSTPKPTSTIDPNSYIEIDIRELDGYTDDYIGQRVRLIGEVFNVGDGFLQINVQKPGGNKWDTIPVYVEFRDKILPRGVYEDTFILVYGVVKGEMRGTNLFGGVISQAEVSADKIEVTIETESTELQLSSTPTSEPTVFRPQDNSIVIAKNNVAIIEDSGIIIELLRVLICDKSWGGIESLNFPQYEVFTNKETIIEFVFRIKNNSDAVVDFPFTSSIASANGEQAYFFDFLYKGPDYVGDDLDGDILPGSYIVGAIWTGYGNSSWEEVEKIVLSINGAYGENIFEKATDNYLFTIEVSDWEYEPIPEGLKDSEFR